MSKYWFPIYVIILFATGDCVPIGGIAGPRRSFSIPNQKNTFLILHIKDYEIPILENRTQIEKNKRSFNLYVESYDYEADSWIKGISYPVNPSHEYFRSKNDGLYKNVVWQFFSNSRREEFQFGCEYRIPLPSGVNKFTIMFFDFEKSKRGFAIKKIDLSENQSIRVEVSPEEFQSQENLRIIKDTQNWPSSYRYLSEQIIDLTFHVEKTPPSDSDLPCNL
ncbi:hypothetical protein EHO59_05260 [Leptospira semungkisensis]|uniref:Uncharacterized protein n=1 Tax=Leptospira semungkisensis TaxID=2484985 RepID=A0A4R9G7C4_9LEPT|nr:hypothetical protein [Leptospira semungkisensis]TGK07512.1 hypothetical protein EHO59_05260 [Leptospira semungkisensis]